VKPDSLNVFDAMGTYWAEIADKNQTQRQIQFLKNTLKKCDYVLDLACGSGRHSIPLSQQGYTVVGLDVSAKLLKIAKQRSSGVQVVRGDLRALPFKSEAFAAAVSMDTSLGYLPTEHDDMQSLTEVRQVLGQAGVFVVDVFNREYLAQKYKEPHVSDWIEYPSFFLQQKRQINPGGDRLCDLWAVHDRAGGRLVEFMHSVRLYRLGVLQDLLEQARFAVRAVFGDYEEQAFNANSQRLILVAAAK
jgi:SAM-dependent methyltransferase